jgi:hypothetical protein
MIGTLFGIMKAINTVHGSYKCINEVVSGNKVEEYLQ